jgi:sigma-B regulation protein RsbU (phosphoserine phosphatase)
VNKAQSGNSRKDEQTRRLLAAWSAHAGDVMAVSGEELPDAEAAWIRHNNDLEKQINELQQERNQWHRALFGAGEVQRKLCAPRKLRRGRFEIASEIFPVRYISGDFSDVLDLPDVTGLVVGDVAGKGVAAGLWVAHFIGLIRIHAASHRSPAATIAALNRDLFQVQSIPQTGTLFLGHLDADRGELVYCSAGHPPAFLVRRDGKVEAMHEGGPLLGAVPSAHFSTGRAVIEPGDTVIAYSDGILDCRNGAGEDFGPQRLLAAARGARDASSAGAMLFSVLGAVQDFAGDCPREDDFTLMIVRRTEP